MKQSEISALTGIAQRRFRNFSEAAGSVLESLKEGIPGVIALARLEPDQQVHRVIEVRGEGIDDLARGSVIRPTESGLDADFLSSIGAQAALSAPLEISDGRIAGVLCAVDAAPDAFGPEHAVQLGVAARLLSHEWESVELRSELRRLRARVDDGPGIDPETGLLNREGFLEHLDHEWRLSQRGTVESVLFACCVGSGAGEKENGAGDAQRRLALKQAAEVLQGSARVTDRVGRFGEMTMGAILVGCPEDDAPAFIDRFLGALGRVSEGSGPQIEVSCGVQRLASASSPEEVLDLAEKSAGEPQELAITLEEARK
jgi:GGDEF domain-containing protein